MSPTVPRRYWLTGASSGIGLALAEVLLGSGAHVALSARSSKPLEQLARHYPGQVLVVAGDLTNSQAVREIGERIAQTWGSLDSLILNAGTCEYVDAKQLDTTIIEHVVRTNLLASSYCIDTARPLLHTGQTPHLVGIASAVTYLPMPRIEASGTSRAGLRYLFESLRSDLSPEGIDVTVVSPGFVDTALTARNDFPMPLSWPADKAARHIFAELDSRPLEITFPALSIATLWPLSKPPSRAQLIIGKRMLRSPPPHKDDL
ncbi:SDR family NAD(P)-dependent oxidoreductase [Pseudomonas mucidolens]|uniref:Short-chain dehydrogenase n=1 Tax=Pseudomonas mucidolens TaxID=46679 RepID=A0A1H2NGU8_9PSED|nr:SDR family oxidoreductase [Pseudomonas mucidolens]SDV04518.1 Short-chain dehydrogenase [Pseudomonas mucidolens]SQH31978.1 short chain dehydrogenase/reductase family protein [Pseudomonas mucidolens]